MSKDISKDAFLQFSRGYRVRKAYWTAFVVLLSYVRLSIVGRFFGEKWYKHRITALHLHNAERVKDAILDLQGLFIKMGQLLSILSNFLPEAFQRPLEGLQDRLPARPIADVRQRIVEELGKTPEALFRSFDPIPIATASIGQAHKAVLQDGTDVIVKVQHYGIEEVARIDLDIIQRLTRIISWFMDIKGMEHLYTQIRKMIKPHPGNILIEENGRIVLLDFGATAQVPPQMREGISQLIEAAIKNDTGDMNEACRKMGFLADGPDAEKVAKKMIIALRNFLQNEVQFEGLDFRDIKINPFNNSLTDLIHNIGFKGISGAVQIPKEYVLLNRTITLLLGISNAIAPQFNPLDVIRPYMQEYVLASQGGTLGYIRNFVQRTLTTALTIPDDLQKVLRKARNGEIEVQSPDTLAGASRVARTIQRLVFAVLAIGLAFWGLKIWEMDMQKAAKWSWGAASILALLALGIFEKK